MDSVDFLNQDWEFYLTRPFNLFCASLWFEWYFDEKAQNLYGGNISDALILEESTNMARQYRLSDQIIKFNKAIEILVKNERKKCAGALKLGLKLNEEARDYLSKNKHFDFEKAVVFSTDLMIYSSCLPYFTLQYSKEGTEIFKLSEELRKSSLALEFIKKVIEPKCGEMLNKKLPFEVKQPLELLTHKEVLNKDWGKIKERNELRNQGLRYLLHYHNGEETVFWQKNLDKIQNKLEKIKYSDKLTGQVAFAGFAKGTVRVIVDTRETHQFNDGDILLTINSNPTFMPYIMKSSAIITDEGGIACHASIISRELKIPCIVGTKVATKVLKDGDMVEVDADKGIIRII